MNDRTLALVLTAGLLGASAVGAVMPARADVRGEPGMVTRAAGRSEAPARAETPSVPQSSAPFHDAPAVDFQELLDRIPSPGPGGQPQQQGPASIPLDVVPSAPTPAAATQARGRTLEASEASGEKAGAASAPAALIDAIAAAFSPEQRVTALRVAACETHSTFNPQAVGRAGEQGTFQVLARFHGPVPSDYLGQAQQAAAIVAADGDWREWSCK